MNRAFRRGFPIALCLTFFFTVDCRAQQLQATPAPVLRANKVFSVFGARPKLLIANTPEPYEPLSAKTKLALAFKESVEWPKFAGSGALAYLYYVQRKNPAFGSSGYGEHYAAATADQALGSILSDGVFPAFLHQDPRHIRLGTGSFGTRLDFAVRQSVVARTDNYEWNFATARWVGAGVAIAISNLYYRDSRTIPANFENFGFHIGGDTLTNVFEEFWPDIKRRLLHRPGN